MRHECKCLEFYAIRYWKPVQVLSSLRLRTHCGYSNTQYRSENESQEVTSMHKIVTWKLICVLLPSTNMMKAPSLGQPEKKPEILYFFNNVDLVWFVTLVTLSKKIICSVYYLASGRYVINIRRTSAKVRFMTPFNPSRSIKGTKDYSSYTISILRRWPHGQELGMPTQNLGLAQL